MSQSLFSVLRREIGQYLSMSILSHGFGINIFLVILGLSLVSPRQIWSFNALRVRFGHCTMNHSNSLEEIPSGPPQLLLFSLAVALVSSSMPIGASRSLLY